MLVITGMFRMFGVLRKLRMSHMNTGNSKTVPAHDGSAMEVRLYQRETLGLLSAGGR